MPLRAVSYVSDASFNLAPGKIEKLVRDAASFNYQVGVTGILLFDGARFLQYLEGQEQGVEAAYHRILKATSHENIIVLNRGRIGRPRFPCWSIKSICVDPFTLAKTSISDWTGFALSTESLAGRATAIDQLVGITRLP